VKIAQLAPLSESVPPKGYGGTELVISQLTEELIRRDHEVVLFATGDSETAAELQSVTATGLRSSNVPSHRWAAYEMQSLIRFMERKDEFDVVHNHMGYLAFPYISQLECAVVSTLHNPIQDYNVEIFRAYKHLPSVAISDAYKRLNYPDEMNYVGRVYNAVDAEGFDTGQISPDPIGEQGRQYLLFLGRVSHAKGTADAIKIAKAVGMPLKIAGKVDTTDREYFEKFVEPELNQDVEYIGEVAFHEKAGLYRGAKAVVYPIHFEEPFGLVMAEALASGTPLLALERGSVREVIDDQVSVIGKSVDELIQRYGEIDGIKSSECIAKAKSFSVAKMASGYEEIYRRLIAGNPSSELLSTAAV